MITIRRDAERPELYWVLSEDTYRKHETLWTRDELEDIYELVGKLKEEENGKV